MLDALLIKEELSPDVLEAIFLQAMYWSLGASLLEDGRVKFDNYIKYIASMPTKETEAVAGQLMTLLSVQTAVLIMSIARTSFYIGTLYCELCSLVYIFLF